MRLLFATALLLTPPLFAQSTTLTAAQIMERVAAHQDAAEADRAHFVYLQHARVQSRRGSKVLCDEVTDGRVTPTETGSRQTLLHLDGRMVLHGKQVEYHELRQDPQVSSGPEDEEAPPANERQSPGEARETLRVTDTDGQMDQQLVENLRHNLTDSQSKDGFQAGLFPLTGKAQSHYMYTLVGRERRNGRDTFHLTFHPVDEDDFAWRGDAWIDTEAFEPVVVQTALARKLPFGVRVLLGTNVPGLGFTATYAPQATGTWFPVTFGSEFKLNVLFFLRRTVTLSVENRGFERTHVASRIVPTPPDTDAP